MLSGGNQMPTDAASDALIAKLLAEDNVYADTYSAYDDYRSEDSDQQRFKRKKKNRKGILLL